MTSLRKAIIASALFIPALALAESTTSQPIARVLYDGAADYLYVVGNSTWGAPSCPNATYIQVVATVPGRKQLLATALAAHVAGQVVRFQGTCNSNTNYFDATYIEVQ